MAKRLYTIEVNANQRLLTKNGRLDIDEAWAILESNIKHALDDGALDKVFDGYSDDIAHIRLISKGD